MCEAVDTTDSRYPGWYCCRDNTFNGARAKACRVCKHARDNKETPVVIPRPPRRKKRIVSEATPVQQVQKAKPVAQGKARRVKPKQIRMRRVRKSNKAD